MSPEEQALLEARAVMNAHLQVLGALSDRWADGIEVMAQVEKIKTAAAAYARLPRPQQRAA